MTISLAENFVDELFDCEAGEHAEFALGFLEAVLHRMGVSAAQATHDQFAAALTELQAYVMERRPELVPPVGRMEQARLARTMS